VIINVGDNFKTPVSGFEFVVRLAIAVHLQLIEVLVG
jgi:hypothetical protein